MSWGLFTLNHPNTKGIMQKLNKLHLEAVDMIEFQTHLYIRKGHPLANKDEIELDDLVGLTFRFTQERKNTSIILKISLIPRILPSHLM